MNTISLKQTLPEIFADRDMIISDIWHQNVMFEKGGIYLIEAASGTGKSSLYSFIYGYRKDYQGIIDFDDKNIKGLKIEEWVEIRKHSLSMLFQELRLFPELTALENIQVKNSLTGYKNRREIIAFFDMLGIGDKLHQKVERMSFGQQQRVALIRALCQPCDFLFLDEPVSHLDEENNRIVSKVVAAEAAKQGAGILVTSIGKRMVLDYTETFKL